MFSWVVRSQKKGGFLESMELPAVSEGLVQRCIFTELHRFKFFFLGAVFLSYGDNLKLYRFKEIF